MNTFNQFDNATTSIKVANMPKMASAFKSAMLNYKYATNCEWYEKLVNTDDLKAFNIFNIKFDIDRVNQTFIPVIKDIATQAGYMEVLKAIAPFMENGSLFIQDGYRYYTINFDNGKVTGTKRTVNTESPVTTPTKQDTKKPVSTNKKQGKKNPKKEAKKFEFTRPTVTPVTVKRDNNTYTVQELVKELLKQMDKGNASKLVKVEADFLFLNEATA